MPLGTTALSWLTLLALVLAAAALGLAVLALSGRDDRRRPVARTPRGAGVRSRRPGEPLSPEEMSAEVQALQADAAAALRHVAVVRYDAFADMGGHLSWSLALLDDGGDGVLLTAIHGRSDSRTYAKNVTSWSSGQQLSPEEEEAVSLARSPR